MSRGRTTPLMLAWAAAAALSVFAAGCGGGSHTATPVSSSSCEPMLFEGKGKPQYLIVSDLPLRAPPGAKEQVAGIVSVLRQRHFRAGRYTVGYQSCDNSTAASGSRDLGRCLANAKEWAADQSVLGVIGPYNSDCALLQIPVASAAKAGPLLMIGTATTDPELTAKVPGGAPGTPDSLYPGGVRNFVRLTAPDQFQAAAAAMLARNSGLDRVYVLDDGEPYGANIAHWFGQAAAKLRVPVVGRQTWNPKATDYQTLVKQIAVAHPDGVYLSGFAFLHGGLLLKELKARYGERALYFAPDGFSDPAEDVHDAGKAAEGLVFTLAGVPSRDAGPAGKALLAKTGPEPFAQYGALYGATAATILLDAIGRSDGSRDRVRRNALQGAATASLLGPFGFDREGDPTRSAIGVFAVQHGEPAHLRTLYPTVGLAKNR